MIPKLRHNSVAILCATLLSIGALYIIILVVPMHVLKNWHISVEDKTYHPSDTVILKSSSTKVRKSNGTAARTLVCTSSSTTNSYAINNTEAKRPPGSRKSTQPIKLRDDIPTPSKCKICIEAHYTVWGIKPIVEKNCTNSFTVDSLKVPSPQTTTVYVDRTTNVSATPPSTQSTPVQNTPTPDTPSTQPTPTSPTPPTQTPEPTPTKNCAVDVLFLHLLC